GGGTLAAVDRAVDVVIHGATQRGGAVAAVTIVQSVAAPAEVRRLPATVMMMSPDVPIEERRPGTGRVTDHEAPVRGRRAPAMVAEARRGVVPAPRAGLSGIVIVP